jgi:glycosyltransferase involved in cell wall biosynthesis
MKMILKNWDSFRLGTLEVVIVNDSPEIKIELNVTEYPFDIQIITNPINMGIHRTRENGLSHCRGEYVLFLDQDDVITEDYLQNQCSKMGDSDFIVSNGYKIGKNGEKNPIFASLKHQKCIENIWCYCLYSNPIVSPGQAVIKKAAVPEQWKKAALENNGADDCLLWILLLSEKKKIMINSDFLYFHIETGENTSLDTTKMMKSVQDMLIVLKDTISPIKRYLIMRRAKYYSNNKMNTLYRMSFIDVWVCRKLYYSLNIR